MTETKDTTDKTLRGGARKFVLDPGASAELFVGPLRVETARRDYLMILREELPDAVVGDVFSLDLSLPLRLRREDPRWKRVRLFWLVGPDTPARLREAIAAHAPEIEALEGGLGSVAERLAAAPPQGT